MTKTVFIGGGHDCSITLSNATSLSAGDRVSAFALDRCQIKTGEDSFIQCRHSCEISVGSSSKIDAGNFSKVTAGIDSSITVGPCSTVTAGENSEIRFTWWLGNELETTIARIGQNGLLPNTPYQLIEGRITAVS
ncbi:hypothetical protein L4K06_000916 [Salmonella enterica]|uniref:Uncharacterized protein n=2 Tax=Salmonella TaxID=590 RepID=A0A748FGV4_SALER|nr:hypothetical protein [Salmonella enterica]AFK89946.1 hypothetical protein [Salmonella sp. 14]EAW2472908.1 hypothetical protein [Salmonella enterica subsp. enterica]EBH0962989.1 hypothetical protein [Salmonella enterica subsp. enterica serovar Monschaui]ECJ2454237.1 hypothetical protein [Salmonella enterica subsp. salamae]ECK7215822.1 hypothetical protein [Salmonella enterica subsp. enterica serovar Guinea]ECO0585414.1 hypothetical protein [Salmonella enterica subsp. diarizonae]ECW6162030.